MRPKSAFGVPKTVSDPGGRNGARNREVLRVNNLFCQCARLHHPRHLIRALQRKKRGDATGVSRCEAKDSIFDSSDLCTPLRARGMRTSPQLQRCHDGAGDAHPPGEHCYGRERDADRDAKRHIGSTAESDSNLERGQRNMFAVNPRPAIGRCRRRSGTSPLIDRGQFECRGTKCETSGNGSKRIDDASVSSASVYSCLRRLRDATHSSDVPIIAHTLERTPVTLDHIEQ